MEKKKISLKDIGMPKLILMFMAGVLLIFLSFPGLMGGDKESKDKDYNTESSDYKNDMNTTSYDMNTYISELESKLKNILRKVQGIGDVEVMITLKTTGEKIPLKDVPYIQEELDEADGEGGSRTSNCIQKEESTVMITDEEGNTEPYILQERIPEIEGVVVIAEGGDNVFVIKDVIEACEVLFNIPAHKVKVMKMGDGIKWLC